MTMKYNQSEIDSIDNINHRKRAQMAFHSKLNNSYKPSDDLEIFFTFLE